MAQIIWYMQHFQVGEGFQEKGPYSNKKLGNAIQTKKMIWANVIFKAYGAMKIKVNQDKLRGSTPTSK